MQIRFVYSVSRQDQAVVQLHDQQAAIEVEGAPDHRGLPLHQQLFEAERRFADWFKKHHPAAYLIQYVAGPADGSKGRFSEYRAHLPA